MLGSSDLTGIDWRAQCDAESGSGSVLALLDVGEAQALGGSHDACPQNGLALPVVTVLRRALKSAVARPRVRHGGPGAV